MTLWDNTHIEERSITIKVLRVGTKQLTQSLFKQLPARNVIDVTIGQLAGEVWGTVTLPDAWQQERRFVIWEYEGTLFQIGYRKLTSECKNEEYKYLTQVEQDYRHVLMAAALDGRRWVSKGTQSSKGIHSVSTQLSGIPLQDIVVPEAVQVLWTHEENLKEVEERIRAAEEKMSKHGQDSFFAPSQSHVEYARDERTKLLERYEEAKEKVKWELKKWADEDIETWPAPLSEEVTRRILSTSGERYLTYKNMWHASLQAIEEKGQLFIGV